MLDVSGMTVIAGILIFMLIYRVKSEKVKPLNIYFTLQHRMGSMMVGGGREGMCWIQWSTPCSQLFP